MDDLDENAVVYYKRYVDALLWYEDCDKHINK